MIRLRYGWGKEHVQPCLYVTRSQNQKYDRDRAPYRHAGFRLMLGTLGMTVWVHNDSGNSIGGGGWYWEWRGWGFSLPRSPIWKF
jgi:hypothetical protein